MLVVHPNSVSGGGGGSGTFSLITPHSRLSQPDIRKTITKHTLPRTYHYSSNTQPGNNNTGRYKTTHNRDWINYPLLNNIPDGAGLSVTPTHSDLFLTQPDLTLTQPDLTLTQPDLTVTQSAPHRPGLTSIHGDLPPVSAGVEGSIRRITKRASSSHSLDVRHSTPEGWTSRAGSDRMIARFDRKSFLSSRQEKTPKVVGAVDFRGMYHKRRVGLVSPPASSTSVKLQLDKFPIWGHLRRSTTDLRNSLPSKREIDVAREQILFFADRRGYTRQEGSESYQRGPSVRKLPRNKVHSEQLPPTPSISWASSPYHSNHPHQQPSQPSSAPGHGTEQMDEAPPRSRTPSRSATKSRNKRHSAKSLTSLGSAHSARSSPVSLQMAAMPPTTAPSISLKEKLQDIKVNMVPDDVTFTQDGRIESGLYPTTFKQVPGVIDNNRRQDIFIKYGGHDWKPSKKPIIYENIFFPRVTCLPVSMGIRYRTEMDLAKSGKLTPGLQD